MERLKQLLNEYRGQQRLLKRSKTSLYSNCGIQSRTRQQISKRIEKIEYKIEIEIDRINKDE